MKDKYIIVDKESIEKRIKELEQERFCGSELNSDYRIGQQEALKQILNQSISLVSEVKKAFDAGSANAIGSHKDFKQMHPNKKEYIENLEIDI
jgi:hypothetical protein